jgi:DNA repair protein RecO (recombination protein O)
MDATKNTPAIILNRQPYREYDALVTVYTRDYGRLSLVVRGVKKMQSKLAGHIEPLTWADFLIIPGKTFDYAGSVVTRAAYAGIRNDLNKLYYAGRALNLFSRFVKEGHPDERLFFLLRDWLDVLNDFQEKQNSQTKESSTKGLSQGDGELFYSFFALKLLAELGYVPEMRTCLVCGRPIVAGRNFFDLKGGGLVCDTCREQKKTEEEVLSTDLLMISDNCVKLIRYLLDSQELKIKANPALIKEAKKIIDCFLNYI